MDARGRRWRYEIASGQWFRPDGHPFAFGHSGFGDAMNDPSRVRETGIGPIPPGLWWLKYPEPHPRFAAPAMRLVPLFGTETFGRDAFYCHGANPTPDPTDDSHGCPILARPFRLELARSDVRLVEVVPGDGPISIVQVLPDVVDSEFAHDPPPKPTAG